MKKLILALAIAGMTAGVNAGEKNLWTALLTKEVPAGCQVDSCPPPCKNDVCCDDSDFGGYVFAYGGGSLMGDDTLGGRNGVPAGPFTSSAINVDDGYILGGGVGLRHCALGGIRLEIEQLFSELDVTSVNGAAALATSAANGDISYSGTFFNLLKEINFDCLPCVTAYVGGGIGYANVDLDFNRFALANLSDSDSALAYQLIAGADYNLCDNLALFLQYKAINIGETDHFIGATDNFQLDNFWTHNVVAGLRFSF